MSSAAALPLLDRPLQPRVRPTTVPPGRGPDRPALRVLEGGRAPRRQAQQALYRRRRLTAVVLAVSLVIGAILLANAVLARPADGGVPSSAVGTSSSAVHVVQPGDTLWSIAAASAPEGDVRIAVDQLKDLNGGAPLQVGQRLRLP